MTNYGGRRVDVWQAAILLIAGLYFYGLIGISSKKNSVLEKN